MKNKFDKVIDQNMAEAIRVIGRGVSSMKLLLRGLRQMARLGYSATERAELDMNILLSNIAETMSFQIRQSEAEVRIDNLGVCFGDKALIEMVFLNFVSNAIKYLDPSRTGLVQISSRTDKGYSVYCVQDNGRGINADELENIFKMHYRIQPAENSGEGLGLAIVRRIVNRYNGSVWAQSEPGKGSKFFVALPSTPQ